MQGASGGQFNCVWKPDHRGCADMSVSGRQNLILGMKSAPPMQSMEQTFQSGEAHFMRLGYSMKLFQYTEMRRNGNAATRLEQVSSGTFRRRGFGIDGWLRIFGFYQCSAAVSGGVPIRYI